MKDFALENDDLVFLDGDLFVSTTDAQHLEMILKSTQGEWKENPDLGVNLIKSQSGKVDRFLKRNIEIQLQADGYTLEKLNFSAEGIEISGNYGNTNL